MKAKFRKLDIEVSAAWREFEAITNSDIGSAYGQPTLWRTPSERALAVYDEVVRQKEAQADCEAEI